MVCGSELVGALAPPWATVSPCARLSAHSCHSALVSTGHRPLQLCVDQTHGQSPASLQVPLEAPSDTLPTWAKRSASPGELATPCHSEGGGWCTGTDALLLWSYVSGTWGSHGTETRALQDPVTASPSEPLQEAAMVKTAFPCSGHRWTLATGPGVPPGPRASASGVAPDSSWTPQGLQGK